MGVGTKSEANVLCEGCSTAVFMRDRLLNMRRIFYSYFLGTFFVIKREPKANFADLAGIWNGDKSDRNFILGHTLIHFSPRIIYYGPLSTALARLVKICTSRRQKPHSRNQLFTKEIGIIIVSRHKYCTFSIRKEEPNSIDYRVPIFILEYF